MDQNLYNLWYNAVYPRSFPRSFPEPFPKQGRMLPGKVLEEVTNKTRGLLEQRFV